MALMSQHYLSFLVPKAKSIPSLGIQMVHKSQSSQLPNTHLHAVATSRWSSMENDDRASGQATLKLDSISQHNLMGNKPHIQHSEKLKEVRDAFRDVIGKDPLQSLVMIDALQRLGIDYHFEEEIRAMLSKIYLQWQQEVEVHQKQHLFQVALAFRLLRQERYCVSADVFQRFLDNDDVLFISELSRDVNGWSSLYEASQLSMEGEDILVQAESLSRHVLAKMSFHCGHCEAKIIENTLLHPHHTNLARFGIKKYIHDSERNNNKWRNDMKQLAKLDFNIVQLQHQKEAQLFHKWWDSKGLAEEMKQARNEPLKWYLWSMAILADPRHSEQRIDITKPISLIYTIDDVYDVYGTPEELVLFTKVVNRWDYEAIEQLPLYMRECFQVLDETTEELSDKIFRTHGQNAKDYLRQSWGDLCNAYLMEAKWFKNKHLPAPEEYLKNGTVSSGVYVVLVHLFFLLGENMTSSNLENFTDNSHGMINSVATVLRLSDDLGSAWDENEEGADGSYVDCYMNKHTIATRESAQKHVRLMISDALKRLNTECLTSSAYSSAFSKSVLNLARMVQLMYRYDTNHCLPELYRILSSQLYQKFSLPEIFET